MLQKVFVNAKGMCNNHPHHMVAVVLTFEKNNEARLHVLHLIALCSFILQF